MLEFLPDGRPRYTYRDIARVYIRHTCAMPARAGYMAPFKDRTFMSNKPALGQHHDVSDNQTLTPVRANSFTDTLEAMHIVRYRTLANNPARGNYVPTRRFLCVLIALMLLVPRFFGSPACRMARDAYVLNAANTNLTLAIRATNTYQEQINYFCPGNLTNPPLYWRSATLADWPLWWFGVW